MIGCATNVHVKGKFYNDMSVLTRGATLKPELTTKAQAILEKYNLDLAAHEIGHENCE
jgi:hypothetical protein